MEQGQTLF